ncbi:galactose-6-phosphate isomerase subunit LacB [Striga asiatica]|uniref:Galactose-6-phosphate isomerase subunit LacB n=1 Tax=Striga asiatica TaxID=4170 RepID=A0A5A7P748_STRAF|nr:galactose-6-phosphate isomerase subunit LacB [Striga asiatica]
MMLAHRNREYVPLIQKLPKTSHNYDVVEISATRVNLDCEGNKSQGSFQILVLLPSPIFFLSPALNTSSTTTQLRHSQELFPAIRPVSRHGRPIRVSPLSTRRAPLDFNAAQHRSPNLGSQKSLHSHGPIWNRTISHRVASFRQPLLPLESGSAARVATGLRVGPGFGPLLMLSGVVKKGEVDENIHLIFSREDRNLAQFRLCPWL